MNSMQKGNITEIAIQLELVKRGYDVFTPITDGSVVDLIFMDELGVAKKVQIKTCVETGTGFSFDARKATSSSRIRKKRYSSDEIDYFCTIFNGVVYLVPVETVGTRNQVCLRLNEKYKNQNKPLFAKDFKLENYIAG